MKIKTYYQINEKTCGISSLKTFMYYHSLGKIDLIKEDIFHESYSLLELKNIAENYGFTLEGIKYSDDTSIKEKSIILLNDNNILHYVFFINKRGNDYYFIDPTNGKIKISKDAFIKMFTGYSLILINKNKKFKKLKKRDYNNILCFVLEIIVSIPLMLSILLFFKENYFSFVLLITYWILLFIKKFILLLLISLYDKKLEQIIDSYPNLNERYINILIKYKTIKYSLFSNIYNYILMKFIFLFSLLLLKNGYILSICFSLLSVLEILFYNHNKNIIWKLNSINKVNNINKYITLNKYSTKYVKKYELFKVFIIVIFIISLIIFNLFNKLDIISNLIIICLFIFITNQSNLYTFSEQYKNYNIGKTVYTSLKD